MWLKNSSYKLPENRDFLVSMISLYKTWLRLLWTGLQFVLLLPSLWNTCVWYGFWMLSATLTGFPGGTNGKEPACQTRRHKRLRFNPWVGKIPWRRAWQPTLVFLPRTEEPGGLQSTASQRSARLKLFSMHSQPVSHNFPDLPPRLVSWMNWRCVPYEEMQRDAPHNLFGLQSSSELAPVSFRRQCTPLCLARVPRRPVSPWGVVAAIHISSSPEGT